MKVKLSFIKNKSFFIPAIVIVVILIVYILFFKPNPLIRLNISSIRAEKNESALSIQAPSEVGGVGRKFIVKINVDTMGNSINAVQSYLKFDPKSLQISTTSTTNSFCKFYPENNYSNTDGIVKLSCGTPYPGFRGTDTIQEIEFISKAINTTNIYLNDQSMVLANDGKGTNLLRQFPKETIKIKAGI